MTDLAQDQRAQTRLGLAALLLPVFFAAMFAACIIGAYHKPHPNNIKVGVVGPASQTAALRAGLAKAGGSAFDVSPVGSPAAATHAVRQRDLDAAYVPTANPKQPATVIVASGGGRLVAKASEDFVRGASAAQGAQLVVRDVRPLASGDALGLGVFMFMIVCTIAGYLGVTVLETLAPNLPPSRRYPMIVGLGVVLPAIVYLIGGLGFGTYSGSFGTILAFIGVAALYTVVVALVTRLLAALFGPPALFLSLTLLIFLNIPSLGATYTDTMLPSFWRFFNGFWIGAQTVDAERSILYFGGQGVGTDILMVLAWTGVAVALLLVPLSRKLGSRRESPEGASSMRASTMPS